MKKYFYFLFFIGLSINFYAQNNENDSIINGDKLAEKELYSLHNNGWVHMEYRGMKYLLNLSNKDYILYLSVNCKDKSQKPSFLIEFTNNYRDGNRGGLDFTSSKSDGFKKIVFIIDEQEFENPFKKFDTNLFEKFIYSLKNGKTLTIKFFDNEINPETGKDQLDLNRALKFMLENSELLDESIDCRSNN